MKIRMTDLLDEYLDDDLPLDAMPDILPGDRPEAKSSRAAHRLSHRKRAGQIVAAVLIVASISVAGGLKLWGGGSAGKSLAAKPAEMDSAVSYTPEPTAAVTPAPESTDDAVLEDGGYFDSTITVDGEDVNVSAGNLTRSGSTFTLTVTVDTQLENVTGFLLSDYQVYLVLLDGTTVEPTASSETSYLENPFVRDEVYAFDDISEETALETATLYLQIRSVTILANDSVTDYTGSWDMAFSIAGIDVPASVTGEEHAGETIPEGQDFSITDLQVSESGCTFWLHTPVNHYMLVPQGQLALAAQQGSDETYYGFSILTDGTLGTASVTIDSSTMSTRGVTDTQNLVYCTVTWKETIEPTSITGLYFTDGTTGQTVEVSSYAY